MIRIALLIAIAALFMKTAAMAAGPVSSPISAESGIETDALQNERAIALSILQRAEVELRARGHGIADQMRLLRTTLGSAEIKTARTAEGDFKRCLDDKELAGFFDPRLDSGAIYICWKMRLNPKRYTPKAIAQAIVHELAHLWLWQVGRDWLDECSATHIEHGAMLWANEDVYRFGAYEKHCGL